MSNEFYFQFARYSQPLLIGFGTIGAVLNQILFFYRQPLRKSSCSLYFRALSTNDLLVLYIVVLPSWIAIQFGIDPSQQLNWYCKFKTYFSDSLYTLSPYLVVLACFDRLCTSSTNTHLRKIATVRIATYIIPAMVIFIFAIYCHIPIWYKILPYLSLSYCSISNITYSKFIGFFLLFILSIIPPVLMIVLCTITVILLRQQRRRVMPANQSRLRQRDNQLIKMLFIYVAFNVACTLPFTITFVLLMLEQPNYVPEHVDLFRLFALLLNVNFSSSFYAYTLSTPFYRHELYNLIRDFKAKLQNINHLHSIQRTTHESGTT